MTLPRKRRESGRGAVAVEAALVTPILILLVFGIIEMALLMRDTVATTSAVRVGARIGSTAANAGPGTCEASSNPPPCTPASAPALAQATADAIQRAGSAMPKDNIEWILVYQANTKGYPLPESNTGSLTCSTNCVKYVWDKNLNGGKFRYANGSWNSTTINACINDAGRMALGVAMQAKHPWVTGLFGNHMTLDERSVMQFEPLPNDTCKPGKHS